MSLIIWEEHFKKNESKDAHNDFFIKVLETSHDEIYVCDREGRTIYCNKTFEKNYGIKREDMLGKSAMYLVDNGYSNSTPIPTVIKTKKQSTSEQKTTTGRTLIITATPYLHKNGEIDFIVENCRDITEIQNMKNTIQKKENEIDRYKSEIDNIRKNNLINGQLFDFNSPEIKKLQEKITKIADSNITVLIQGESGTGKTEIAKVIHSNSSRKSDPFISINCSTIPSPLFESELFGYESGAFTGAKSKGKLGLIELANGGTVFLDEIGEIPLDSQAKLLEFIQNKSFIPVGGVKQKKADVRIIAATNQNLASLISEKKFREDLYYRLNVVNLTMPPIRERKEDLPIFIHHFLLMFNKEYRTNKTFSNDTLLYLNQYNWPGNIRELQNLIHNLVLMAKDAVILPADLPPSMLLEYDNSKMKSEQLDLTKTMEEYEKAIIQRCYRTNNSSYKLAKSLKISQSKAMRLIKKYNL
jgi:PAS domain S-box-containing protein